MSLPNRNNPYSFDSFVQKRDSFDFYAGDPLLQKLVRKHAGPDAAAIDGRLRTYSKKVSGPWRQWSEVNSLPENRPWIQHFDGHNHRIDRVVRPQETLMLEREVFGSGIFSAKTPMWERLTKLVLVHQLGEAGVTCAMACTEGLIALIEAHLETSAPQVKEVWRHCKEGTDGHFGTGSQFLTEIQGGSDVPANLVEAVPDGDHYRLYGTKFFCSACHTDFAVVTAKITGSEDVSTFIVPSWLPGDKEHERRNGYIMNRLKRKLGTIELPTAEIEYRGAVAYPVGPLGKGVQNVVGVVLTLSRLSVSIGNTAGALRAAREARMYADFRTVFGVTLSDFPITESVVGQIEHEAHRMAAGLYRLYGLYLGLEGKLTPGLPRDADIAARRKKFMLRELIMLQKLTTTRDAIGIIHQAMSVFAGHGVMECFSSLPRLLRDAMINEQWEGPRNMLLHQIHNDMRRVAEWYSPREFVADILAGAPEAEISDCGRLLEESVRTDIFAVGNRDAKLVAAAKAWDTLAQRLYNAYQDVALVEIG